MRSLVLLALACTLAFATPAGAISWSISTVDGTVNSGWTTTLRIDPAGHPRVAYWTPGMGIRIAAFDGGTWTYALFPGPYEPEAVPARVQSARTERPELLVTNGVDLALDPWGDAWLAHVRYDCFGDCSGMLRVTHLSGGIWATEDLEATRTRPSIEVGADGRVHVVYATLSDDLVYVVRDAGGTWTREVVGAGTNGQQLRLDANGVPHIAWTNPGRVWHSARVNGQWQTTCVDSLKSYKAVVLALGPQGEAHVSFGAGGASAGVWYARPTGSTWSAEQVVAGTTVGYTRAIALDPAGDPLIAYNDQAGLDLDYASRKHGAWLVGPADTEGNTGYSPSIAMLPSGQPLIAYEADYGLGTRLVTGGVIAAVGSAPDASRPALRLAVVEPARGGRPLVLDLASATPIDATLELIDVAGRRIAARASQRFAAGVTRVRWDIGPAGPGVYFARAKAAGLEGITRIVVLR